MLNDNSLSDRLNAVKYGKPLPTPPMQQHSPFTPPMQQQPELESQESQQYTHLENFKFFAVSNSLILFDMILSSFLYGFAMKTIFALDWSLFGTFAVGFLINQAFGLIARLIFSKTFKKK